MKIIAFLLLWIPLAAMAQKQAEFDPDKIRLTEPDRTVIAHTSTNKVEVIYHDRFYFWYGGNAIHQTEGGFSGRLLNGQYQEFYANKNLREQGEFKNGLKNGVWQNWSENGVLKEYVTWKAGQKDGDFKLFNADGNLLQSGNYKNNLLDGKIRNYKGSDSVRVVKYQAGKLVVKDPGKKSLWQKMKHIRLKKKSVQAK